MIFRDVFLRTRDALFCRHHFCYFRNEKSEQRNDFLKHFVWLDLSLVHFGQALWTVLLESQIVPDADGAKVVRAAGCRHHWRRLKRDNRRILKYIFQVKLG
jgi:hypothetical protein